MLVSEVIFVVVTLIAFGALAFAWKNWRAEPGKVELPAWRRAAANLGFLAVAAQAALFIASWTHIGRDYVLFGRWARWVLPSFLVALPCVLAAKGASRRWLLSSSVLLFVICFFIVLSA
jgi:hypothetical protein